MKEWINGIPLLYYSDIDYTIVYNSRDIMIKIGHDLIPLLSILLLTQ